MPEGYWCFVPGGQFFSPMQPDLPELEDPAEIGGRAILPGGQRAWQRRQEDRPGAAMIRLKVISTFRDNVAPQNRPQIARGMTVGNLVRQARRRVLANQ